MTSFRFARAALFASFACIAIVPVAVAAPATPQEIPIQGEAIPLAPPYPQSGDVAARIYADSSGGSPVWDSGADFAAAISQGTFSVVLGSVTPLMLDGDARYFLELDVHGNEVIGDAAGGRWPFFPGGGSHARSDLEARLDALEAEVGGWSPSPLSVTRATRVSPPARAAGSGPIVAFPLLGIGRAAGGNGATLSRGTLLLQPVGAFTGSTHRAWLGPEHMPINPPSIGVEDGTPPVRFELAAARPNPFAHSTFIRCALPVAAPLALRVYDLRGRLVRTLRAGALERAGHHDVAWDGRDDSGRPLATGLYLLRMETGTFRATRRLTLVR